MRLNVENEQALITKKKCTNAFSINRKLVNSKSFHDKFALLPLNNETQEAVYKETGRLLEFADGQEAEYLVALDYYTGKRVIDNFGRKGEPGRTGFTEEEYSFIEKSDTDIIVIHNHSYNGRPSARDLITFCNDERIRLSIIACHCGELYAIFSVKYLINEVYEQLLDAEKSIVDDIDFAKRLASTKLYILNDKLSPKKKLFDVRRL